MSSCLYRHPVQMKLFWNSSRMCGTCFAVVGPLFRKEYKMTRLVGSNKQHNIPEEKTVYSV